MVGSGPPRRRSLRIAGYDYAQPGTYFVTFCTAGRACILGRVHGAAVALSPIGNAVHAVWCELPQRFAHLECDACVIMPNHVHAVVCIRRAGGPALVKIVGTFKSLAATRTRALRRSDSPLWQRGFHERVVRDAGELDRIRQYIAGNPAAWSADRENPAFDVSSTSV